MPIAEIHHTRSRLAIAGYVLLLVYGSLYPFTGWHEPLEGALDFLAAPWPRYFTRSDILTNLLVYLPLGVLLAGGGKRRPLAAFGVALSGALLLSLTLESLQTFLPGRVASRQDWLLNGLGAALGALAVLAAHSQLAPVRTLRAARHSAFLPGQVTDLALLVLGLWALAQLIPLLLYLDANSLQKGLMTLWRALMQPALLHWQKLAADTLSVAGLGLFVTLHARSAKSLMPLYIFFIAAVLLLRLPVTSWRLSLESGAGALLGLTMAMAFLRAPRSVRLGAAAAMIFLGFALAKLAPEFSLWFKPPREVNWVPFAGRMHSLHGFADMLASVWPFLALAALARHAAPFRGHAWVGGGIVLAVTTALELAQQGAPGYRADMTNVLLALAGWTVPWWWQKPDQGGKDGKKPERPEAGST
jgi:VanZ family protein